jgi:hypothetical protein
MAKVTITLEDAWKDGLPTLVGKFEVEAANNDDPDLIPSSKIVSETFKRLWDVNALMPLATLVCQDLVIRNRMMKQQRDPPIDHQMGVQPAALPPQSSPPSSPAEQPAAPVSPPEPAASAPTTNGA